MKEVIAPEVIKEMNSPKLFLGGTIANGEARDWQREVVDYFKDVKEGVVFNPRRTEWDKEASSEAKWQQINWELNAQRKSNILLYHFEDKYVNPITLLELGYFVGLQEYMKTIIVSCPKSYTYYDNVCAICIRENIRIFVSLEDALRAIKYDMNKT